MNIQNLVWPPTRLLALVEGNRAPTENFFRWLNGVQQILVGTLGIGVGAGTPVVIPLAKLTGGGADGSITLTNGVVTAFIAPT